MSYSCDKLNNSISKNSQSKQKERKYSNAFTFRRYSPNNNKINNMTLIPNQETSSSGITNISIIKEKEKPLDFQYFSFPIKPLEENITYEPETYEKKSYDVKDYIEKAHEKQIDDNAMRNLDDKSFNCAGT